MATRTERVVLELDDRFSSGMARAAAQTALLDRNLNSLDGSTVRSREGLDGTTRSTDALGVSMRRNSADINQFSGRLRLIAEAAATLGPALIPIGGVGAAAVAGLASQASIAALAGGSMLVAFQGVGDALKTVEAARLDPTVQNLEKAREAMAALGPDAGKFVTEFQRFRPVLGDIRDAAAAGWFPGLTESLTSFEALAPKVMTLFEAIGKAGGEAIASGAESLASGRWEEFFAFLETEAPATITSLGKIIGDLAHGAAEMWMSFQPLNNSFTGWLEDVADGFDSWASSAGGREDIESFMDYVRETGPAVGQAFGSLIDAFTQITQAAAPLGGPVLQVIAVFAEALASLANSPIGTPLFTAIAAMSAFSRASKLLDGAALATSGSLTRMGVSATTASRGMAALQSAGQIAGGLLLVASAARSINDATRDTLPGLDTMMLNLRQGAGADGASKLSRDFSDLGDSIERLYDKSKGESVGDALFTPFKGLFGETSDTQEALDEITAIDTALAGLVDTEGPKVAASALDDLYQSGLLTKDELALLADNLPEYENALSRAASATDGAASSTGRMGAEERKTAAAIREGIAALRAKTDAALGAFDAETQYRQALKAAREQGAKNNAGIRGSSEAALANRGAISSLAAAWNNQSEAVKNNGGKFREARKAFIETATAMGVPKKAAEQLARKILDIPKSHVTVVTADTAGAAAKIQSVKAFLDSIPRYIGVRVVTTQTTVNGGRSTGGGITRASGGIVYGPGTTTSDSIPAMLSNKEYVVKAAAVEKYGVGFFDQANAMRLAGGGFAGGPGRGSRDNGTLVGVDIYGSLRGLKRAFNESEKAVDRESSKRDKLTSRRDEIRSGIAGGLTGDIWAGASNPWTDGASSNPTDILNQETATADEFKALVKKLKSNGLDGAALAEVVVSGDIERARMMAALPAKDLRQFERAFNTRQQAVASASAAGGQAVMGAALAGTERRLDAVTAEMRAIKNVIKAKEKADDRSRKNAAKETGKEVNGAAGAGKRDRVYAGGR